MNSTFSNEKLKFERFYLVIFSTPKFFLHSTVTSWMVEVCISLGLCLFGVIGV